MLPKGEQNKYLTVEPDKCRHKFFEDCICLDCGFECTNHKWNGGQCDICGLECDHYDTDGHCCIECGLESHEFMDFDSAYESYRESQWE